MRALVLLLACLLPASNVLAQRWVETASSDSGDKFFVDSSTVRKSYGYVQAWLLTNFGKPSNSSPHSRKSLNRFKCESSEIALTSFISYAGADGSGSVLDSNTSNYPQFSPVAPGTVGSQLLEFICAYSEGEAWAKRVALYGGVRQAMEADAAAAADASAATSDAEQGAIAAAERAAGLVSPDLQTSSVSVVGVALGSALDAALRVEKPKAVFKPYDTIYASISIENPNRERARLGVEWTYESTDQRVNSEHQVLAGDPDAVAEFHIAKPDGWPEGGYRLDVYIDGKVVQSLRLRVSR